MPYIRTPERKLSTTTGSSRITRPSPTSRLSPDGLHIATVRSSRIELRSVRDLDLICSFTLPVRRSKFICLAWAPATQSSSNDTDTTNMFNPNSTSMIPQSTRLLYATTDSVYIYDTTDPSFLATISNGSGGLGPISYADFGFDDTEVMVWTGLGASICVWSIDTGRMIAKLDDPKFFLSGASVAKGCGWRTSTDESGVLKRDFFALLTRDGPQDVITLWHSTGSSYEVVKSWKPDTIDAQGIKWSPSGRWLATWDSAALGYKVLIMTAEGQLLRTYRSDHYWNEELEGLGVRSVECDGEGYWLAVAGYAENVTLLNTYKFSPAIQFHLPTTLKPSPTRRIHQELITSGSIHSYTTLTTPISAPTITTTSNTPAIKAPNILTFSLTSSHLATTSPSHPSTLYIFDMSTHSLVAVLVQHSIIKSVSWSENLLLMTCESSEGKVYIWDSVSENVEVVDLEVVEGVGFIGGLMGQPGDAQQELGTPLVDGLEGEEVNATVTMTGLEDTFQNVRVR